jgi:hypothetical protein
VSRFANQKKISLEKQFYKDLPPIQSNPSSLQLVVFNIIEDRMTRLDKNSKILLQTNVSNGLIAIRITSEGTILETVQKPSSDTLNETIMKELGGKILQETGEEILITLPKTSS